MWDTLYDKTAPCKGYRCKSDIYDAITSCNPFNCLSEIVKYWKYIILPSRQSELGEGKYQLAFLYLMIKYCLFSTLYTFPPLLSLILFIRPSDLFLSLTKLEKGFLRLPHLHIFSHFYTFHR